MHMVSFTFLLFIIGLNTRHSSVMLASFRLYPCTKYFFDSPLIISRFPRYDAWVDYFNPKSYFNPMWHNPFDLHDIFHFFLSFLISPRVKIKVSSVPNLLKPVKDSNSKNVIEASQACFWRTINEELHCTVEDEAQRSHWSFQCMRLVCLNSLPMFELVSILIVMSKLMQEIFKLMQEIFKLMQVMFNLM